MEESDAETLQTLLLTDGQDPSHGETFPGQQNRSVAPTSRLGEVLRHPLVVTLFGFFCTGILGTYLTWWLAYRSHLDDTEASIRNSAVAAVSDISDLVNERRTRGELVISAVRRGAPESEVVARKVAYDEAYVRWNTKVPGDLLRVRAMFHWSRSRFERYIDGLTNANVLLHGIDAGVLLHRQQLAPNHGLFSIMDACITRAFDSYRVNSFILSSQIS